MSETENKTPVGLVPDEEEIVLDEERKRMLIKNYFFANRADFPSWFEYYIKVAYFFFALGLVFLIYFNTNIFSILLGSISVFLGIFFVRKWLKPYKEQNKKYAERPTSEEMDEWLIEDIQNIIRPKSIEALTLDESKLKPENFIIVPYPIFWNEDGLNQENIFRFHGEEEHFKYSAYKVQVLALTENYISLYTCVLNWFDLTVSSENTNEFFYDDISSIKNDMEKINNKPFFFEENPEEGIVFDGLSAKIFRIRNMSGEVLSLITDIPTMECSNRITANINKVIQVLRIMLRNRRFGESYYNPESHKKEEITDNTSEQENYGKNENNSHSESDEH